MSFIIKLTTNILSSIKNPRRRRARINFFIGKKTVDLRDHTILLIDEDELDHPLGI